MNHLSQEDLVLSYYGDAGGDGHLADCDDCRAELRRIALVLDRASELQVPEPDAGYEARVWQHLNWRLRGEKKTSRRSDWIKWTAIAAGISLAFLTGLFWKRRPQETPLAANRPAAVQQQQQQQQQQVQPASSSASNTAAQRDRILFVVVGDHFDQSERILVELTNLRPEEGLDISAERGRAEALLASNRLYRQSAQERGEDTVSALLDELEPVLLQIAHAPAQVSADELRTLQQRVEKKGLVLKLRVVRSDVRATPAPPQTPNV